MFIIAAGARPPTPLDLGISTLLGTPPALAPAPAPQPATGSVALGVLGNGEFGYAGYAGVGGTPPPPIPEAKAIASCSSVNTSAIGFGGGMTLPKALVTSGVGGGGGANVVVGVPGGLMYVWTAKDGGVGVYATLESGEGPIPGVDAAKPDPCAPPG